MTGNALALTDRDRLILAEVLRFGALTRNQLMALGVFRSKSRANERLKKLADAQYLTIRVQARPQMGSRFVYVGGPAITSAERRRRLRELTELSLAHEVGLVDIRIAFERHTSVSVWRSDRELESWIRGVEPDAFVEYTVGGTTYCAFVEYDRGTETLGRIERKVRAYKEFAFSGGFTRAYGRRYFRLLFVADSTGRLSTLSRTARRVTDRIVRLTTLTELTNDGPLASIWRRPGETSLESLTS